SQPVPLLIGGEHRLLRDQQPRNHQNKKRANESKSTSARSADAFKFQRKGAETAEVQRGNRMLCASAPLRLCVKCRDVDFLHGGASAVNSGQHDCRTSRFATFKVAVHLLGVGERVGVVDVDFYLARTDDFKKVVGGGFEIGACG